MRRQNSEEKTTIRSKAGFWILLVAAVVLEATNCILYLYTRHTIREEAVQRAQSELRAAELEINAVTSQLEAAVQMLARMGEDGLGDPEEAAKATRTLLETLDNVESAGIAFTAGYYPKKGKWYEVCSSRVKEKDGLPYDSIYTRQIGSAAHDYLASEWFSNGLSIDSAWWCEPYNDDAGAQAMVVCCSYPIRDKEGRVVAVALVDLSLEKLMHLSQYLQVYQESYYSIASATGVNIVTPPDTVPGRRYLQFDEEIDATGWRISIIIPEDILYADLKRAGLFITILMLIGLAVLVFIMFRSANDIRRLVTVNTQKERMIRDLEIARNIQMAMLPKTFPPYPNRRDLAMYGVVLPAKEVGGDLYDFYERDGKLFLCIGDVSGKGVPAALVMAMTRSLFRSLSAHEQDTAVIATQINDAMSESNELNMFVTLFLAVMDLRTGEMNYCNAGHNAPVLNGEFLPTIPNLPIGILSGFAYTPQNTTLQRGDMLFFYTDGLTEAENESKTLFGEERMINLLRSFRAEQTDPNDATVAQRGIETMLNAVHAFVGKAEQSDDLTMLAVKWLPEEDRHGGKLDKPVRHSIVMRNDIQQIPTLAEWVESLHIPDALNMTINLALEEAVTNVMLYAYPGENGKVLIEAEKTPQRITFTISDSGIPFDPTQRPEADITLPAEDRAIGGLGIHLVRQIMDDIHYERKDNRNILTLVKKL